ncbi:lipocalin family protein [Deinococcus yavapaiensis]|uniref:Putative secreted hydrolase n=1 Tax=Deinococcus yavapaiensis KR-236 TaxID=694435 RepID=A0A318SBN3_9DEIO|nr:lipocalin family protein [Deinococcus yavapaiensis]PYE56201.1 putative secreted hydrolase [Deinococcus yavapaiensis KR-236]
MRLVFAAILTLSLAACAPRATAPFDPNRALNPDDFGPQPARVEWWYVSGYLPDDAIAFHWAQFKVTARGIPYTASHVAVTDLRTDRLSFQEQNRGLVTYRFPPLEIGQGRWKLRQEGSAYTLKAESIDVRLTPTKPNVIHPPGYSGTAEVGRLYYQSNTRMTLEGTIAGRPVKGLAWLDHQWGDQLAGTAALWDWFGLHLSNGVDLMVYRVKDGRGRVVQQFGSFVDPSGVARNPTNVQLTPMRTWTSSSSHTYGTAWTLSADEFELQVEAVREDQELRSRTTYVAYWEGPMKGRGRWRGEPVEVVGMGEFVGGALPGSPIAPR